MSNFLKDVEERLFPFVVQRWEPVGQHTLDSELLFLLIKKPELVFLCYQEPTSFLFDKGSLVSMNQPSAWSEGWTAYQLC